MLMTGGLDLVSEWARIYWNKIKVYASKHDRKKSHFLSAICHRETNIAPNQFDHYSNLKQARHSKPPKNILRKPCLRSA